MSESSLYSSTRRGRGAAQPPERALPIIKKVLAGSQTTLVKQRALFVLSQIDSAEAQQILIQASRSTDPGLRGDAIPYEVRLLSVVDAYDALTSHRAYRSAPLTHNAALATLRREADGGKWDSVMVEQLCAMLGDRAPAWDSIATVPAPTLRLA